VGGEIATGLKSPAPCSRSCPLVKTRAAKSKQERRATYLGLLVGTGDLMTWHNHRGFR
jgi:hypothetical protein